MAYRLLDSIDWLIGTRNCLKVSNPDTIVPQVIIDANTTSKAEVSTGTITTQGDNVFTFGSMGVPDTLLMESDFLRINGGNLSDFIPNFAGINLYDKIDLGDPYRAGWGGGGGPSNWYVGCIVDDENQRAYLLLEDYSPYSGWHLNIVGGKSSGIDIIYNTFVIPPISYNWQSVPSISGKNGILSLVTLDSESVNDGEPVSGAAVSVFDQNPASGNNVKDIVDGNTPLIPSAIDVTANFIISNPPVGELASRILAAKKGSIPESIEDADKTVSIPANATSATMPGLDENSQYYFAIFVADATGDTAVSDPKDIYTSGDEGYNFDYTGEIVEWTVPKTGIYSLETWGAQGGDATDGTNSARGGYGAYAYGEVLLTQGEKLYINVGGQNGYGGGGNYIAPNQ